MAKNGAVSKIVATVAAGIVLLIVAILLKWGPAIQDNTHAAEVNRIEIKRVDGDMKDAIIEQRAFREDTREKLHAIDKGVLRIEEQLKHRSP